MLRRTLSHVPGIRERGERRLWSQGVTSWEELRRRPPARCLRSEVDATLDESERAWRERDAAWFGRVLRSRDAWRVYREFQDGAAYLDIETAGSRAGDTVTCVAVADRRGVRLFVRDRNLDDLPDALRDHDVLVTFNGASFDLPVLRHALRGAGAAIDRLAHFDVCHALRRLGHHGGLKLAERSFGVPRDDGLHGLDGSFAVELWERHLRGDPRALPTLARYCAEDVLGLPALASLAANALLAETPFAGELAPIPVPGRIESYLPFSRALVSELVAARAAAVVSRPAERLGDAFE